MAKKKATKTFADIEADAKKELKQENIAECKDLLKERLREIKEAEAVLVDLREQYQGLLEKKI